VAGPSQLLRTLFVLLRDLYIIFYDTITTSHDLFTTSYDCYDLVVMTSSESLHLFINVCRPHIHQFKPPKAIHILEPVSPMFSIETLRLPEIGADRVPNTRSSYNELHQQIAYSRNHYRSDDTGRDTVLQKVDIGEVQLPHVIFLGRRSLVREA